MQHCLSQGASPRDQREGALGGLFSAVDDRHQGVQTRQRIQGRARREPRDPLVFGDAAESEDPLEWTQTRKSGRIRAAIADQPASGAGGPRQWRQGRPRVQRLDRQLLQCAGQTSQVPGVQVRRRVVPGGWDQPHPGVLLENQCLV
ncbi:hypothetical protein THSYN_14950 [Candidatus Thiodictyon syntrophicum]|uniref:Uncharacterized protein n=1 Tax=Candidatus Thiodictyon syntrophicum TaxID=1166950 RepID=A0A2K8U9N4_9GAMM|nr:hypothetical protein THSYN_14950 [Candidatus Thiodictyon syntrophicum]